MATAPLNCPKRKTSQNPMYPSLPDYLRPNLDILFVGINPGLRSAQTGHHFAGYSNRFWKLLYEASLVSEPLGYKQDWRLLQWNLGLTNIVARSSAGIESLTPEDYRRGAVQLARKVRRYRPRLIALLGVTIFRILFPEEETNDLGLTSVRLADVPVFLLPNPSGRNAHYPYARMLDAFRDLRAAVRPPTRKRRRTRSRPTRPAIM